jgi:hypothetical protein
MWPARFVRQHGPPRPVVERVLREFLKCGLLEHGFARLWCGECRSSVLVAFSCRSRSFCPSCEKKKQLERVEFVMKGGQVIRGDIRPGTTLAHQFVCDQEGDLALP